jgi:amyloid beta precursor protein binding protein 1
MESQNKYDRQMRLWGEMGQLLIHKCKILLINCDPCGVEALKNLVLPGVHKIGIVDDQFLSNRDLNNFFVNQFEYDEGRKRAQEILANLLEMNPEDVRG